MVMDILFTLILASILGFLAGIGIGGGSLLILWLTGVLNMPYPQARILNLLFFLPAAVIACLFRFRQGCLPVKKVVPGVIFGMIAAGIFAFFGRFLDVQLLQKLFGGLLVVTGIRELLYKPRKT